MPKTFPIRLEVEEIALGTVLRRLNDMAGIAKIDLDLGHGGQKALPHANGKSDNGESAQAQVVTLLMDGPKHISELSAALGGKKARVYGAMHALKKKKIVKSNGAGVYQLSEKTTAELSRKMQQAQPVAAAAPALPSPVRRGPKGRAAPGSGNVILRTALDGVAMPSSDLRARLASNGMSTKSISGVLDRGKRAGLIKLNGNKAYELTAKGMKIALPNANGEAAHG